jgi:hypothetical protein
LYHERRQQNRRVPFGSDDMLNDYGFVRGVACSESEQDRDGTEL